MKQPAEEQTDLTDQEELERIDDAAALLLDEVQQQERQAQRDDQHRQ